MDSQCDKTDREFTSAKLKRKTPEATSTHNRQNEHENALQRVFTYKKKLSDDKHTRHEI